MISDKRNYHEIDTIRFITISIIVWTHSLFKPWHLQRPNDFIETMITSIVIQLGAISTVIFFIVSGILMHSKLQKYTLKGYFKERIPVVYAPWLFIICINVLLIMLHQSSLDNVLATKDISPILTSIYVIINGLVVYGPYWFVLTYLIGMVVLILFKQYSSNIYFGFLLFSITALYALNFHFGWIDTFHTKAVLAYTFFIWLGFQFHRNWTKILLKVQKISWYVLSALMLVFFSIACYEGYLLTLDGVRDPYASNRFTNIIFSIIFFFFLLKIGPIRVINNLRPRQIVYGIYLVNSIIVLELTYLLKKYIDELYRVNIWALAGLQIIFYTVTLIITYFIVKFLLNSSLKWMIGAK